MKTIKFHSNCLNFIHCWLSLLQEDFPQVVINIGNILCETQMKEKNMHLVTELAILCKRL